ncbi:hypothetical protein HMN09_01212000 [Mycena chlorophos]|uniref:Uncharacterized protein n=1 Tax=Mycena chlorophos TaxID=658473 RepID=A0A8H6S6Y5_MYCCL|nr:hypothetical protein HMN09_01212000 [Mycena chlorophos]
MLHIAFYIRTAGPEWVTWAFQVERENGFVKRGITSKKKPWANIDRRLLDFALIDQVKYLYDVTEELNIKPPRPENEPTNTERQIPGYPSCFVRTPCQKTFEPSKKTLGQVAYYLRDIVGGQPKNILKLLPTTVPRWGGVRILDKGDSIRAAWVPSNQDEDRREATFVRFEMEMEREGEFAPTICYGTLLEILQFDLPEERVLGSFAGRPLMIAVITPASISGDDASEEIITYRRELQQVVVEMTGVVALAGRFKTQGHWVILDRTNGAVRPEFVAAEPE